MSWRLTAKGGAYLAILAVGVAVGIVIGRPEPLLLVVPLAVSLAADLGTTRRSRFEVDVHVDAPKVSEGEVVALQVDLRSTRPVTRFELAIAVPPGLSIDAQDRVRGLALRAGEHHHLAAAVTAERWGRYDLGGVRWRGRSRFGLLAAEGSVPARHAVAVYPRPETLHHLVSARRTQSATGSHLARTKGTGVEYADMRPFAPGDRMSEVNWRATARRGTTWVNERHPDRSTDVVLFLDSFGNTTLPDAVRTADALAGSYLAQRDRVGLVVFGGTVRWLRAGSGLRQRYQIIDALLATRFYETMIWKGLDLFPPRALPHRALVIAISPLDDDRAVSALIELADRGVDLVIVEVSPVPAAPPAPGAAGDVAHRLWRLQRSVALDRYRALGVPVVELVPGRSLAAIVEEVHQWRRARPAAS
ncbi:MAG TPA: DUF58 domain-containing protein [Acidimicrobiales bacterium]